MFDRTGIMSSRNFSSSLAVWSALVEMMRFPCWLKLAATTLRCFEACLEERVVLMSLTILLGSGRRISDIPLGRNWATSLDGWCDELGLLGIFMFGVGAFGAFGFGLLPVCWVWLMVLCREEENVAVLLLEPVSA